MQKLTVAAFVAPWCGYCKKLGPEFDRAAENLKGLVNIGQSARPGLGLGLGSETERAVGQVEAVPPPTHSDTVLTRALFLPAVAVDCDEAPNKQLCAEMEVQGTQH